MAAVTGTITGQINDFVNALVTPASQARVSFTPSVRMISNTSTQEITFLDTTWATVQSNGTFTVSLVATNTANTTPTGWAWQVRFHVEGRRITPFYINVPGNTTTNLSSLVPVTLGTDSIILLNYYTKVETDAIASGKLAKSSNLSDVSNKATARTNLELRDKEYPVYWTGSAWGSRPSQLPSGFDRAIFKSFWDSNATNPSALMQPGDVWWKAAS